MSKIFESCLKNRLYAFLNKFKLITNSQFGFLKQISTNDALNHLTEFLYKGLNSREHISCIFVDLRKAFDTVNHSILLGKLEQIGVRGLALDLFRSYLSHRKQYVNLNGNSSTLKDLTIGVPQGSILGPLLFLVYINELPSLSDLSNFTLFADDTTVAIRDNNIENLSSKCNTVLELLNSWSIKNRLTINFDKTEFMISCNSEHEVDDCFLSFGQNSIQSVKVYKFLSVLFQINVNKLLSKVSNSVGLLYKIENCLHPETRLSYYYSFIYPHLTYNIATWGKAHDCFLKSLITAQKGITRTIDGAQYRESTNPRFLKSSILKLNEIYTYAVCIQMVKGKMANRSNPSHIINTRNRDQT